MADEKSQAEKDEAVTQFLELADWIPDKDTASSYLEAFEYDIPNALEAYFNSMEDGDDQNSTVHEDEDDENDNGAPQPIPTSSSQPQPSSRASGSSVSRRPLTGIRTLNDLSSAKDDHDDGDDHSDTELFTGGEKSGLAVQGGHGESHQDRIQGLLDKAKRSA
jgi:UBX domain-containing protein 1